MKTVFEHFTPEAKNVILQAEDVALELGARCIGVGHMLYGCASDRSEYTAGEPLHRAGITSDRIHRLLPHGDEQPGDRLDAEALRAVGVDYKEVRDAAEATFGPGSLDAAPDRRKPRRFPRPNFDLDAKHAFQCTVTIIEELHQDSIKPGHLLLGLLRVENSLITMAVEQSGADRAGLWAAVLTRLSLPGPDLGSSDGPTGPPRTEDEAVEAATDTGTGTADR